MELWKDRVIGVRTWLGITQAELAHVLRASVPLVKSWETRAERPYSAVAEKFCALESVVAKERLELKSSTDGSP